MWKIGVGIKKKKKSMTMVDGVGDKAATTLKKMRRTKKVQILSVTMTSLSFFFF